MSTSVPHRSVQVPDQRAPEGRRAAREASGRGVQVLDTGAPVVGLAAVERAGEYVLRVTGPDGGTWWRSRDLLAWEPAGPAPVDTTPAVLARGGWSFRFAASDEGAEVLRAPVPAGPWAVVPTAGVRPAGVPAVVPAPDGATPYALLPAPTGVLLARVHWAGNGPAVGDAAVVRGRTGPTAPPSPVLDPDVPHTALRAWVEGGTARVAGIDVPLPPRPALLTATTDGATVVVALDGVVVARHDVADLPAGPAGEHVVVRGGAILHAVTTSRLEDEHRTLLTPGSARSWDWGGGRPVVAEVAVRGRATLALGADRRTVDTVDLNGGTGFAVVVLDAPGGADRLHVVADTDTEIADVVLAARAG